MKKKLLLAAALMVVSASAYAVKMKCWNCIISPEGEVLYCEYCEAL